LEPYAHVYLGETLNKGLANQFKTRRETEHNDVPQVGRSEERRTAEINLTRMMTTTRALSTAVTALDYQELRRVMTTETDRRYPSVRNGIRNLHSIQYSDRIECHRPDKSE
jgi:hypothetical protein